jgi:hypothetical protein
VLAKVVIKTTKYNIVVCRYDKMLVNVAAYVIMQLIIYKYNKI